MLVDIRRHATNAPERRLRRDKAVAFMCYQISSENVSIKDTHNNFDHLEKETSDVHKDVILISN